MHVFYAPDAVSGFFKLSQEETHHCIKVLRFRKGDSIVVSNGKGFLAECVLSDEDPTGVQVRSENILKNSSELKYHLHIAISPLKNMSRFEWFVEKAAEMRVAEITPLICKRTEKTGIRIERLRKISLEAMKQSVSERLTIVHEPVSIEEFITVPNPGFSRYIASCADDEKISIGEMNENKVEVLIGPEGDFTEAELVNSKKAGFRLLDLGEARLRTETAGVLTAAAMYSRFLIQ
jgi:16S rRNA (uracil1498-N3)-methyltransferase